MVVMVVAAGVAEGKFLSTLQVRNFMQYAMFQKGIQDTVNGNPIAAMGQFAFQIRLGEGMPIRQKVVDHRLARLGNP